MEWVLCFIVNWCLVASVKGWKWINLKTNIWCGIFSIILQTATGAIRIGLGL